MSIYYQKKKLQKDNTCDYNLWVAQCAYAPQIDEA
jgi:hypothetical protein